MKFVNPFELFQKLKASGGQLLGLDVGAKYVGFAVSDVNNKVAFPKSVLLRKKSNIEAMATDFQQLVSQHSLVGFVVGFPFGIHGQANVDAVQVRLLIENLKNTGKLDNMSYTYWNENYSSVCVDALLSSIDLHPTVYKTIVDKFAAVGILQGYLDDMNRKWKKRHPLKE